MNASSCTGMLTSAIVSLAVVSAANAGEFPPPWTPNPAFPETRQVWRFDSPSNPYAPSSFENPNGIPQILFPAPEWLPNNPEAPNLPPGTGVICMDGSVPLTLIIPNYNLSMQKQIWISIKYSSPPAGAGLPRIIDIVGIDGSVGVQKNVPTPSPVPGMPGVSEISYLWNMPTCATFQITIDVSIGIPGAATYIEQLYIHTRCVPTPGAVALLAIGGLITVRRRR
jgi:hypothetical protein